MILASCGKKPGENGNSQQPGIADQQKSIVTPSNEAASDNPLCALLSTGRGDLATLARQSDAESNPLRKDTAQRAYAQRAEALAQAVANFVTSNQIVNYVGTVSSMNFQNYNSGPGLVLGIALPCKAIINFQFVTTNPQWGSPSSDNVALEPWRPTLEKLSVNDTVTFSGRFFLRYGVSGIPRNALAEMFSIEGVITELRKGESFTSPDPEAIRRQEEAAQAQAEQNRLAMVLQNSKNLDATPVATFAYHTTDATSLMQGSNSSLAQIAVMNTGIKYADGAYLWFGNLGGLRSTSHRQTRPGFIVMEDYPYVQTAVRDGKDGSSGASIIIFNYKSIVFDDDATRDSFYAAVIDAFKKWHSQFPEAYDGDLQTY